jgi:hypothetical protein
MITSVHLPVENVNIAKSWSQHFVKTNLFILIFFTAILFSCKKSGDDQHQADNDPRTVILIPDTGQTTSYTSTSGEDADFNINPPAYVNNGNGTVTDIVTGLMWQHTDGGEMTFESASVYCTNLRLGGYTDWRLPACMELFDINNFDLLNPALNTTYFLKTAAEYWYTGITRTDDASFVWVVNAGGGIGAHPKSETISAGGTRRFHVRAVRNTQSPVTITEHFKDNSDGTVTDNISGLIWQKLQSSNLLTWEEALTYASGLSLAGKTDWRLPNIKELQSLNDETKSKPSFNKEYFPNVLSGNFWSSTTMINAVLKAWDLNVDYGIVSYSDKTLKENVLCVR